MQGKGEQRRRRRARRIRGIGLERAPQSSALRNISGVLGDALGRSRSLLGARLRRGSSSDEPDAPDADTDEETSEETASDTPIEEPATR